MPLSWLYFRREPHGNCLKCSRPERLPKRAHGRDAERQERKVDEREDDRRLDLENASLALLEQFQRLEAEWAGVHFNRFSSMHFLFSG